MQKIRRIAEVILSAAFWLVVWAALSYAVGKEILLPSPVRVFARLFELMGTGEYYGSVFFSLARISLGFIIGTLAGCLLAYFSFTSKTVEILVSPMLTVVKSTPVASFIILALVWMGKERVPVFTSVLMVLPVVYSSTLSGFRSTDKNLAEVACVYGFGYFKKLRLLLIPSALPSFVSGAKTALGLAWKAGIAAEVLCSLKNSIGGKVYQSKLYLESVDLMAWTLTVIIISVILEAVISHSLKRIVKRFTVTDVGGDEK